MPNGGSPAGNTNRRRLGSALRMNHRRGGGGGPRLLPLSPAGGRSPRLMIFLLLQEKECLGFLSLLLEEEDAFVSHSFSFWRRREASSSNSFSCWRWKLSSHTLFPAGEGRKKATAPSSFSCWRRRNPSSNSCSHWMMRKPSAPSSISCSLFLSPPPPPSSSSSLIPFRFVPDFSRNRTFQPGFQDPELWTFI